MCTKDCGWVSLDRQRTEMCSVERSQSVAGVRQEHGLLYVRQWRESSAPKIQDVRTTARTDTGKMSRDRHYRSGQQGKEF